MELEQSTLVYKIKGLVPNSNHLKKADVCNMAMVIAVQIMQVFRNLFSILNACRILKKLQCFQTTAKEFILLNIKNNALCISKFELP